jgi:hypothetical protein
MIACLPDWYNLSLEIKEIRKLVVAFIGLMFEPNVWFRIYHWVMEWRNSWTCYQKPIVVCEIRKVV